MEDVVDEDGYVIASSITGDQHGSATAAGKATTKKDEARMRSRLKEELRTYRTEQSTALEKPPYTVFTNAAIDGICAALPTNDDELLAVKGIGNKKLEMYGDDIFEVSHTKSWEEH